MNDRDEIRRLQGLLLKAHADHRAQVNDLKNKLAAKRKRRQLRKHGEPYAKATPQLLTEAANAYLAAQGPERSIRRVADRFNLCRGSLHRFLQAQTRPQPERQGTIQERHRKFLDSLETAE